MIDTILCETFSKVLHSAHHVICGECRDKTPQEHSFRAASPREYGESSSNQLSILLIGGGTFHPLQAWVSPSLPPQRYRNIAPTSSTRCAVSSAQHCRPGGIVKICVCTIAQAM
eukprot:1163263-Amphidinium_carterae.3